MGGFENSISLILLHQNYHKLSTIKHKFIFSISISKEFGLRLIGFSPRDLIRLKSRFWLALPYH